METANATATLPQTSIRVRFVEVKGENSKLPIARAIVSLPRPLNGLTLESAIFAERDKKGNISDVSVGLPGGKRFAALKAECKPVELKNGQIVHLADVPTENGAEKLAAWEPQILTAFYRWQKTDDPIQWINLGGSLHDDVHGSKADHFDEHQPMEDPTAKALAMA